MSWWAPYANFLVRLALLTPFAFVMWVVFPIYWANTQLEQYMEKVAIVAAVQGHGERQLTAGVLRKSRELKLPIKERQVHVEVDENEVTVEAQYQVPVDLVATTVKLDFHPHGRAHRPKLTKEGMEEMKEIVR